MNDQELSDTIAALMHYMQEGVLARAEILLRPPATSQQIEECEAFLGRKLSSSYRHFLRHHNGWQGFYRGAGVGCLLGTEDYMGPSHYREECAFMIFLATVYSFDDSGEAPVPASHKATFDSDKIPALYYPENFYRFVDTTGPVSPELQPLKDFIDGFEDTEENFLYARHTIIGFEAHKTVVLDGNTLNAAGDMEIADLSDSIDYRFDNLYDLLQQKLELFK